MMIRELIEELSKYDPDTEVIGPNACCVAGAPFGITEVVEVADAVLSDGSTYPVVMLRSD